jgi:hypothetical protein
MLYGSEVKKIFVSEYVGSVYRGTQHLKLSEARSIATILRKEYPKLFVLTSGNIYASGPKLSGSVSISG